MTGSTPCLLLDVSGSMSHREGERRRIDLLAEALAHALPAAGCRVLAFSHSVQELTGLEPRRPKLPEPGGGTDLAAALQAVAHLTPRPDRLLVISDGEPDDPQAALTAARALRPMTIHSIFVGDDRDHAAKGFMRALAIAGGDPRSIAQQLKLNQPANVAKAATLLLTGPAR
jgi:uncharacterized protein with von Willebrand factor type A (vWA) domain